MKKTLSKSVFGLALTYIMPPAGVWYLMDTFNREDNSLRGSKPYNRFDTFIVATSVLFLMNSQGAYKDIEERNVLGRVNNAQVYELSGEMSEGPYLFNPSLFSKETSLGYSVELPSNVECIFWSGDLVKSKGEEVRVNYPSLTDMSVLDNFDQVKKLGEDKFERVNKEKCSQRLEDFLKDR